MISDLTIDELKKMANADLRELLVERNLNKQEIKELLYRALADAKNYEQAWHYERKKVAAYEKKEEKLKGFIRDTF